MLRRLFTVASALSLLLCIGALAAWPLSYFRHCSAEVWPVRSSDWLWWVVSADGTLSIRPDDSFFEWHIRYWKLSLALAILPGWWLRRTYLRRSPSRIGKCIRCGYDLRASPDHCPECGTPVEKRRGVND